MRNSVVAACAAVVCVGIAFAPPTSADYTSAEKAFLNELGGTMPYPDATLLKLGHKICDATKSMSLSDIAHDVSSHMKWPLAFADTFDITAIKFLCPSNFANNPGTVYFPDGSR